MYLTPKIFVCYKYVRDANRGEISSLFNIALQNWNKKKFAQGRVVAFQKILCVDIPKLARVYDN